MLRIAILAISLLLIPQSSSAEFTSYAAVRSDGSLYIRNRVVWLFGAYIPNERAVRAMDSWTRGFITCEELGEYDDGSISAVCWRRGADIAAEMIRQGVALATPDAPFEYHALERIAKSNGFGVWGFGGQQVIVTQRNGVVVRKLLR